MSTQINVTVDSGGLRRRDQQQRQALRLGKLESDNQRKVEARATDARTAELRKALLGTDGKPLYGTPPSTATRSEEPAAFRNGMSNPSFVLVPHRDYNADKTITGIAKTAAYANVTYDYDSAYPDGPLDYMVGVGPGGANALVYPGLPDLGPLGLPAWTYTWRYRHIQYCADNGPINGVQLPSLIRTYKDTSYVAPISKLKPSLFKSFTFEAYVNLGVNQSGVPATDSSSVIEFRNTLSSDATWGDSNDKDFRLIAQCLTSSPSVGLRFQLTANTYDEYHDVYFDENSGPINRWRHLALVVNGSTGTFYLDGINKSSFALGTMTQNFASVYSRITFELTATGTYGIPPVLKPGIHGLRWTPKALYTTNFTPPASITGLA